MAMTAEQARRRLELYLDAEAKIVGGAQEYRIGDRTLRRADLDKIRAAITELTTEVEVAEQGGSGCIKRIVF